MPVYIDPITGLPVDETGQDPVGTLAPAGPAPGPVPLLSVVPQPYPPRSAPLPVSTPVAPVAPVAPGAPSTAPLPSLPSPPAVSPMAPSGPSPLSIAPGERLSVSTSGYDPAVAEQLFRAEQGRRRPAEAVIENRIAGALAADQARLGAATLDKAEAVKRTAEIDALAKQNQSALLDARARLEARFIEENRAADEKAQALVQGARGRFEQSVAAVRAATVDPTLNFTPVEAAGLSLAVFSQYFLGALGVRAPDVVGMINNWTDRYVNNQMEKIQRGERLLDSEKTLWDMARQDAHDESDARERLRLLTMAQATTEMEVQAAKWNSQLALAQGAEVIAGLKGEYAKAMSELSLSWHDRYQSSIRDLNTHQHQMALVALRKQELTMARDVERARQDEAARAQLAAAQAAPPGIFSLDGSGKLVGKFRPWVTDSIKDKVSVAAGQQAEVIQAATDLQNLYKEKGGLLSTAEGAKRFYDENAAMVDVGRSRLANAIKISANLGAALTDNEKTTFLDPNTPTPTWLNLLDKAGAINVLSAVKRNASETFSTQYSNYLEDPTPEEQAIAGSAWKGLLSESAVIEGRLALDKPKQVVTSVEAAKGEFRRGQQGVSKVTPFTEVIGLSWPGSAIQQKQYEKSFIHVNKKEPEFNSRSGYQRPGHLLDNPWGPPQSVRTPNGQVLAPQEPVEEWAVPLEHLARALVGTDEVEKEKAVKFLVEATKDETMPRRAMFAGRTLQVWRDFPDELTKALRLTRPSPLPGVTKTEAPQEYGTGEKPPSPYGANIPRLIR